MKDHVAAVMDVQFSPTGEELVTASYDRTIRIWNREKGHSRDIYHVGLRSNLYARDEGVSILTCHRRNECNDVSRQSGRRTPSTYSPDRTTVT